MNESPESVRRVTIALIQSLENSETHGSRGGEKLKALALSPLAHDICGGALLSINFVI
jgi:hypothetical protein